MSLCLLTVITPVTLEDTFVDWLMDHSQIDGFTSIPVSGHGASESRMTLAERVSARSRRVMFQLHLEQAAAEQVLADIKSGFAGTDLHYVLSPILEAGHLEQND
ncbi:DUF3240 family protein [Emcibacter nanhaiensis]|uniref:DUF3240 domain-containing protein n=1 Tax=Emcibacter nanhaiensis TaxID=1505037 RepID=A0A501PLD0_9PROT|nr:DUF3240 family protein [Emcibacter nanhaiensis]TPD60744.1 DUF3240 domain-containing protein [Emcibacter nanhaiensis]